MNESYPNVTMPFWAIEMEARLKADHEKLHDEITSLTLMVGALISKLGGPDAIAQAYNWLQTPKLPKGLEE